MLTSFSRQHESEKQYRCQWCSNRFKNKNEAERHQNSLHLRRQSWSCAALTANYDTAFFLSTEVLPTTNTPAQPQAGDPGFDSCGYCGIKFSNNPRNWDERARHLDHVHKYRECNQSRKFFRADHFRQHLKHSHAGKSGKWTTRLEQACVREEPTPGPSDSQSGPNTPTQSAPVANMGGMAQSDLTPSVLAANNASEYGIGHQTVSNLHASHPDIGQHGLSTLQMDMSNIDPNIGGPHLSPTAPVGGMGNLGPAP